MEPSMKRWETAWSAADTETFEDCYTADAIVIPPNHARLKDANVITTFFKGGMGNIDVRFFPDETVFDGKIAYETGIVRDFVTNSEEVVETCHYAIAYVLEGETWKIKFHTWTIPL